MTASTTPPTSDTDTPSDWLDILDNWHQTGCPFSNEYGKCSNADCGSKRKKLKDEIRAYMEAAQLEILDNFVQWFNDKYDTGSGISNKALDEFTTLLRSQQGGKTYE